MLNKEIPFLRAGLPYCAGIISGLYLRPEPVFLFGSLIILAALFGISLLYNDRPVNRVYGFPLTISLFLCGLLFYINEKKSLSDINPGPGTFVCLVEEFPEEKENSYKTIFRFYSLATDTGNIPLTGSLLIYFKKDPMINSMVPGDYLRVRCIINPIANRGNPFEFDYRFYMENHGIKYFSFAAAEDIACLIHPDHRKLKHRALIIREKIIDMYEERGISGDRLALVAAITLGQKSMLDPEQKQIFIKAGVMHIMAVSGLHAVILSVFIFNLLFFMKGKLNGLRILIAVLLLWSFAFVTGLTPSVIRAALMFSFLQAGKLMKRDVNSMNSVLASAFILLIARPSVLFDAGFLLSYSSVIFIICFYRDLYNKLRFKTWIADKIWQSATVTILAQAGTLPLTVALFNRFPTWFILTNIVIVPLSSFLIVIGCLVPLTYPLKFISQPLASFLSFLTGLTEMLSEKASNLPFSTIENIGMVTIESVFFFFVILLFTRHIIDRKNFPVRYPLIALIVFLFAGTAGVISDKASSEMIVYNTPGQNAVGVRTGKTLNFFGDTEVIPAEAMRHCSTRGLKLKQNNSGNKILLLNAGEKKIVISSFLSSELLQLTEPDYIILKGLGQQPEKQIRLTRPVNSLVITSQSISQYRVHQAIINREIVDSIHFIKKYGAFRTRL